MVYFATGIDSAFSNAVVYSWSDSFWSQLWSRWVDAFHTFRDSFLYYFYDSITFSVAYKFFIFFWILLVVAFVSSLIFWDWLGKTWPFASKLKGLWNPKPTSWLFKSS